MGKNRQNNKNNVKNNPILPQIFWFKFARITWWLALPAALLCLVGMWSERFVIIVTVLNRDFLPSAWHNYAPTWVDWLTFAGSIGLFFYVVPVVLPLFAHDCDV